MFTNINIIIIAIISLLASHFIDCLQQDLDDKSNSS